MRVFLLRHGVSDENVVRDPDCRLADRLRNGHEAKRPVFAILTPDFLSAHEELAHLEASWRASLLRRDVELGLPLYPFAAVQDRPSTASPSSSDPLEPSLVDRREQAHQAGSEAYRKWVDAKLRHRPTLDWYEKVYERLRTCLDEEQILSEVRLVLLPGPGLVLYPIVHWNIHSVFWDGTDPDAESDPITRYCTDRLSKTVASVAPSPGQVESSN